MRGEVVYLCKVFNGNWIVTSRGRDGEDEQSLHDRHLPCLYRRSCVYEARHSIVFV